MIYAIIAGMIALGFAFFFCIRILILPGISSLRSGKKLVRRTGSLKDTSRTESFGQIVGGLFLIACSPFVGAGVVFFHSQFVTDSFLTIRHPRHYVGVVFISSCVIRFAL